MKTRIGYVSNSSSTSFLVYAIPLDYQTALAMMGERNIQCVLKNAGTSGDSEDFVFRMSKNRMKLLKKNHIDLSEDGIFLEVIKEFETDDNMVNIDFPLEGGALFDIMKDDSSPYTDDDYDDAFVDWVEWKHRRDRI